MYKYFLSSMTLALLIISFNTFPQSKVLKAQNNTLTLTNKSFTLMDYVDKEASIEAYIKASNPDGGEIGGCTFGGILCTIGGATDRFGYSVAVSKGTLVIGAIGEASNAKGINGNQLDNSLTDAGAVYVFVRNKGVWHQQAYLKASNTDSSDKFGYSVAIEGDTLVVGALGEDALDSPTDNDATDSGAVYVFTRKDDTWSQQAYLKAQHPQAGAAFGSAVAIQSNSIIVGAPMDDSQAVDAGAVYVFNQTNEVWTQTQILSAINADSTDAFGQSVSISGDYIVVGAPFESSASRQINLNSNDNSSTSTGAAYVFNKINNTWQFDSYLKASNSDSGDQFGQSVSISNSIIVVGAPLEDSNPISADANPGDNSFENTGAAYVFERKNNKWSEHSFLKSENPVSLYNNDGFGESVAIDGFNIIIGSSDTNAENAPLPLVHNYGGFGRAYVYRKNNNLWSYAYKIEPLRQQKRNNFASAVAIDKDNIAIGANLDVFNSKGINTAASDYAYDSGAAYVYSIKPIQLNSGLTGLWFNPARKGTGIGVYLLKNNIMVATWYTYDAKGNPIWLIGVGSHDGYQATLDVSTTSGAMFPPYYNDDDVIISSWGQFKIQFSACNAGQFSWIPKADNGIKSGNMPINRLTSSQDLGCDSSNSIENNHTQDTFSMKAANTALWYTLEEGGNLINIYMLDNNVMVAMWYVYDNDGKPLWLIGVGSHDGFKAKLDVVNASGGHFSSFFDPVNLNINKWGNFEIEFSDCKQGLFKWNPIAGNGYSSGEKVINRLTNTLGLDCQDTFSSIKRR